MKVLIIEDTEHKLEEAKNVLDELDIKDIDTASCTMEAVRKITEGNIYDLIICDLGLPLRDGEEVKSPIEGLMFLHQLAYQNILIPTIINSTTFIPNGYLERLNQLGFPLLGQALNIFSLKKLLQTFSEKYHRNEDTAPIRQ